MERKIECHNPYCPFKDTDMVMDAERFDGIMQEIKKRGPTPYMQEVLAELTESEKILSLEDIEEKPDIINHDDIKILEKLSKQIKDRSEEVILREQRDLDPRVADILNDNFFDLLEGE